MILSPVPARRRRFLAGLAGLGAVGSLAPLSLFGPRPAAAADYKALVCIHLFGGNDGHHMIVPTDPGGYERYATVRGRIALPRASLLPLGGIDFGLHPAMASLEGLWRSGQLAPVFNVGPLPRPLTKPEYLEAVRHDELPERLFSHADQIVLWDTASLDSATRAGWGGRACEALATPHPVISVAGTTRYGSGSQRAPIVLPPTGTRFVAPGIDPTASSAAERA
ncbi:MAG: hypothetical protein M3O01_09315, partial [Pseudomonadota bacterium]|nr:hypothetical protein [Pseudomonadota bacterium]